MRLVKVVGSITSTIKDPSLEGFKILLVQCLQTDLKSREEYFVAVDTVGMGEGEIGLIVTGSTAKRTVRTRKKNVDAALVAKVDNIELEKNGQS